MEYKNIIYKIIIIRRVSIVVSIPPCHGGDPGSIPGRVAIWFHGVMVSTQDFESCDPGSIPGGTLRPFSSVGRAQDF